MRRARAGVYAQDRYRQGRQRWRAKTRLLCLAISGPLIVVGIVLFFAEGHFLSWFAGGLTSLGVSAWVELRDTPPSYIENWRDGAEGERKTEKALRPLERAGWRVFHDVQNGHGNYDHIAVGRAGVFLLETKNLIGVVEMRDGVPHLQRRLDPEDNKPWESIRPRALGAAASLNEDIERRCGRRTWVQAVVVFWSDFPEGLVEDGKCVFVHGSRLREWLKGRSERLGTGEVEAIAECVAGIGEEGPGREVAAVPSGSGQV